ncbi:hypothetical protein GWK47_048318 [Chionoecetes opilio]|uniref:Uncharacterized protein n=1 Tax=Chionoecetes opilio TaxID=41210 RepID=A0A8J4Y4G5_CHIOP|nr:hypothetical protein GWK47_048318 [Chionoecetes opilio]
MSPSEEEVVPRPGTSSQGDSQPAQDNVPVDSLPLIFQHIKNTKNRAKPTQIMPGNRVLLKQHKHDKLTTRYDPKPWEVKERRGYSAITQRGEKRILGSTSHMKMIREGTISRWIEEDEDGDDPYDGHLSHSQRLGEHENRQRGTSGEGEIQQGERDEGNEEESLTTRRPRRTTRRPLRYQDGANDSDNDEEGATGDGKKGVVNLSPNTLFLTSLITQYIVKRPTTTAINATVTLHGVTRSKELVDSYYKLGEDTAHRCNWMFLQRQEHLVEYEASSEDEQMRRNNAKTVSQALTEKASKMQAVLSYRTIKRVGEHPVYVIIMQLKAENPNTYLDIVPFLGPFHTQCVMMSAIYKRYKGSDLGKVLVEAGVIAEASVDSALKGKHYKRGLRSLKLMYEALISQLVKERLTPVLNDEMRENLREILRDLNASQESRAAAHATLQDAADIESHITKLFNQVETSDMADNYWKDFFTMTDALLQNVHAVAFLCTDFTQSITGNPYSNIAWDMWIECTMNKGSKMKYGCLSILQNEKQLLVHSRNMNNVTQQKRSQEEAH